MPISKKQLIFEGQPYSKDTHIDKNLKLCFNHFTFEYLIFKNILLDYIEKKSIQKLCTSKSAIKSIKIQLINMEHPIRKFIDELFPSKERQKRQQWANAFIDEEYDDLESLKEMSESQWKDFGSIKKIPLRIIGDIRKRLAMNKYIASPQVQQKLNDDAKKVQFEQNKRQTANQSTEKNSQDSQKIFINIFKKSLLKNMVQKPRKIQKQAQNSQDFNPQNKKYQTIQKKQKPIRKDHPIYKFLRSIFSNSSDEQLSKWTKAFISDGYNQVEQLNGIPEEDWNQYKSKGPIPKKFINDIRLKLQNLFKANDTQLSHLQKNQLCQYMNMQLNQKQILELLGVKKGSSKADKILFQIKCLTKPPKPQPDGCIRVSAKLQDDCLPLFWYKGKQLSMTKYYTLLVMGETGSGKTTLLDAFVNKLTGMEFSDTWRWKLVNQDHIKNVPKGQSQTSNINTYYVNDINNRFNIRIIDTPGFGDTKGIKADDQTVKKFQKLFEVVPEIDYILLTVKSSQTRLKPGSKYIYDRVQQIFGVDAKQRFLLMCTFSDGKKPLCLSTFQYQKLHFEQYFTFNNSSIYAPSNRSDPTTQFFWKMAIKSVQCFANYVIQSDKPPLSLILSKEVLQQRKYLQQYIKTSQQSFKDACSQLDITRKNLRELRQNKKQIQQNGQYTKLETKYDFKVTPFGKTVQMCNICKITCCQICEWPQNAVISQCTYFNKNDGCPKCPGKCPRKDHVRTDDVIIKEQVTESVVISCKKEAYDQGMDGIQRYKKILNKNTQKIISLVKNIDKFANQIKSSLKKLQKIALKPKMWTDQDFYNQMIQQEEERRSTGYIERVKYMRQILSKMKMCQKVMKTATIYDLLPQMKQLMKELKEEGQPVPEGSSCQIW